MRDIEKGVTGDNIPHRAGFCLGRLPPEISVCMEEQLRHGVTLTRVACPKDAKDVSWLASQTGTSSC